MPVGGGAAAAPAAAAAPVEVRDSRWIDTLSLCSSITPCVVIPGTI